MAAVGREGEFAGDSNRIGRHSGQLRSAGATNALREADARELG